MQRELRLYVSPTQIDGGQVAILIGLEDLRAEYFILLLGDVGFRCVSYHRERLEPDEYGCDEEIDSDLFADSVIRGADRNDPWGAKHLHADTLFRDVEDGLELLKGRVQRCRTTVSKPSLAETLEAMRQKARMLVTKRYLDELIAHLDLVERTLVLSST